jgi:hypothetical protein
MLIFDHKNMFTWQKQTKERKPTGRKRKGERKQNKLAWKMFWQASVFGIAMYGWMI